MPLKLRTIPRFLASIFAGTGTAVRKDGLATYVDLDYSKFVALTSSLDSANEFIAVYNRSTGLWNVVTVAIAAQAAAGGTLMTTNTNQTVSGIKTFLSGTFNLGGGTSGITQLVADLIASGTWTLPSTTDTVVGKATTDNLSNKTLVSATLSTRLVKGIYIIAASAVASTALTGSTAEAAMSTGTITIPANSMGANGIIRVTTQWSFTGAAGTRTTRMKFGGTSFIDMANGSTLLSARLQGQVANRNAAGSQVANSLAQANWGGNTSAVVTAAVDTTSAVTLLITGQLANAGDSMTLESYLVELIVP